MQLNVPQGPRCLVLKVSRDSIGSLMNYVCLYHFFFPLNRYKFIQIIRVTKWDTNRIRRTSKHALATRYREASKRKRFALVTKAVVELIRGSLPK